MTRKGQRAAYSNWRRQRGKDVIKTGKAYFNGKSVTMPFKCRWDATERARTGPQGDAADVGG